MAMKRKKQPRLGRLLPTEPVLILVMGVAGSGKTTLAKKILSAMACVYLDNNFLADAFFPDTRTDPEYVHLRPRLYKVLYRITEENLAIGNSVLLDVPHITHVQQAQWRQFIRALARRHKAVLTVVRCICSEETLRERLSDRGEKRDQEKLQDWQGFMRQQPPDVTIPFPHFDVWTDRGGQQEQAAIDYILARLFRRQRMAGGPSPRPVARIRRRA